VLKKAVYGFSDFQKETLDYLLSERSTLTGLIENTAICHQDALDLLRALPEDLSPERRAVVEQALSLVGKVNYFWDSRWGKLHEVTSQGSPMIFLTRPISLVMILILVALLLTPTIRKLIAGKKKTA